MFEIGSSLRQARQHRGLALADVERETHIRAKYLGALEEERFDVLPGVAYVRGFLRTYADALGLDGHLYVDEYNSRFAPDEDEQPPLTRHVERRRELRVARPLALLLAAVAAGTVVVWQLGFSSPKHTTAQERLVVPAARATAPRRATKPAARPRAEREQAAPAPKTLVVRAARGDCWVEVRFGSESGEVVYERVLGEGGTLRFGLAKPLWVRLGAPWNAEVTIRGKRVPLSGDQPVDLTAE